MGIVTFLIDVSGEQREVSLSVNKDGNLVIGNIGNVTYEMIGEEIIFSKVED